MFVANGKGQHRDEICFYKDDSQPLVKFPKLQTASLATYLLIFVFI